MSNIVVIAKPCLPGKAKTRLSPPLTPEEAARAAQVSLDLTLDVARKTSADHKILFWDGEELPEAYSDFDFIQQPEGGLDERLAYLFDHVEGRTLLVGMDTPQMQLPYLEEILTTPVKAPEHVWFAPTADGGFWALAMEKPDGSVIRGVPMSRDDTGELQLQHLRAGGKTITFMPILVDIDHADDLVEVARLLPQSPLMDLVESIPNLA